MAKSARWRQRFERFSQALERLEEALDQSEWKDLEKDGVIQRFEFTFELAWKTLQDFFENQGYKDVKGPKNSIQQAFQDKIIVNGEAWMDLLNDRNLMTHTYSRQVSDEVFHHIQQRYFQLLCDLYHRLKTEKDK